MVAIDSPTPKTYKSIPRMPIFDFIDGIPYFDTAHVYLVSVGVLTGVYDVNTAI